MTLNIHMRSLALTWLMCALLLICVQHWIAMCIWSLLLLPYGVHLAWSLIALDHADTAMLPREMQ